MNPQQSFILECSEEQFEFIQFHMPHLYSLKNISMISKEKPKNVIKQVPEISKQKRPRKCPIDPHYQIDYQFYKNKKPAQEIPSTKAIPFLQKEINSCRNLMENLKKYLLTLDTGGRTIIEAEIDQIQNKLRKSSYTSPKQFMNELKHVWKNLLNSHNKDDPVHKTCIMMEQYCRELISNLNKKKIAPSPITEKAKIDKKMTPEEKYLLTKTNKRSHPDYIYDKQELGQKRRLKVRTVVEVNEQQFEQRLEATKISNDNLSSHRNNEMCPEPTEASLAITPINDDRAY